MKIQKTLLWLILFIEFNDNNINNVDNIISDIICVCGIQRYTRFVDAHLVIT